MGDAAQFINPVERIVTQPTHNVPADDGFDDDIEIREDVPSVFLGIVLMYLLLLAAGALWCVLQDRTLIISTTPHRFVIEIALAVVAAVLIVGAIGITWRHTGVLRRIEVELATRLGDLSLGKVVALALASSVSEEIFFRGAFQPFLCDVLDGTTRGYVATSILFGLLHTGPKPEFLAWTAFATAAGFVLGGAFLLTGNIVVPIVIHFIINAVNMALIVSRARAREVDGITRPGDP